MKIRKSSCKPWTQQQVNQLIEWWGQGKTSAAIGMALGKGRAAVSMKASSLRRKGIPLESRPAFNRKIVVPE